MRTAKLSRSILSILLIGLTSTLLACQSTGGTYEANEQPSPAETAIAGPDANLEALRTTMSKVRTVGTAFLSRYIDAQKTNRTDTSSGTPLDHSLPLLLSEEQSRSMLVPKYLPSLDLVDGWGNPMEVRTTASFLDGQDISETEHGFAIISAGADGVFQSGPIAVSCFHPQEQPNADIAWSDGYFISRPAMATDEDCSSSTTHVTLR